MSRILWILRLFEPQFITLNNQSLLAEGKNLLNLDP